MKKMFNKQNQDEALKKAMAELVDSWELSVEKALKAMKSRKEIIELTLPIRYLVKIFVSDYSTEEIAMLYQKAQSELLSRFENQGLSFKVKPCYPMFSVGFILQLN